AIIEAGQRIQKAGKSAGFLSVREDDCRKVIAAGFGFVAVGSDTGILARQSEALVKMYNAKGPGGYNKGVRPCGDIPPCSASSWRCFSWRHGAFLSRTRRNTIAARPFRCSPAGRPAAESIPKCASSLIILRATFRAGRRSFLRTCRAPAALRSAIISSV